MVNIERCERVFGLKRRSVNNTDIINELVDELSRAEGADDVADQSSAERTVAAPSTSPLLHRAFVAHAHVAASIKDRVDATLVANAAVRLRLGTVGRRAASSRTFNGG